MYNQIYIDDFEISQYEKYLNNESLMENLNNRYFDKYKDKSDAIYLAFKESLDHYVAKKINDNKEYINSKEFKNYSKYLEEIVKKNSIKIDNNNLFLELNTNVVFSYLNENDLRNIYKNNLINSNIKSNEIIISKIVDKIKFNKVISEEEITLLSKYFDNKKDFSDSKFNQNYKEYIKYIMNNRQNLKTSPELVSSILTFLPSYYKNGVENTRTFLTEFDQEEFNLAHSSVKYNYTTFQIKQFRDLDLSSNKSLESSRTFRENDLMFLIFVQFHELTHQLQKNRTKNNNFNIDAVPTEIKKILNKAYGDYQVNHDSDETEIEADEQGWKKLYWFIFENLPESEFRKDLLKKCSKNAKAVNCRRAFSIKYDSTTGKMIRSIDYDMVKLINALKTNPEALDEYNQLKCIKHIIDANGNIKTDILFDKRITMSPAGRTISNYILSNACEKLFINKINSGKYANNEIINLIENFVEVPHANALSLRELKNTDLKTYDETYSRCNIKENLDNVYNTYFIECSKQLLKFSSILENVRTRFGNEYVNSCYKFYIENYYVEMLENIDNPRNDEIKIIMEKFKNFGNEMLKNTANYTTEVINLKNSQIRKLKVSESGVHKSNIKDENLNLTEDKKGEDNYMGMDTYSSRKSLDKNNIEEAKLLNLDKNVKSELDNVKRALKGFPGELNDDLKKMVEEAKNSSMDMRGDSLNDGNEGSLANSVNNSNINNEDERNEFDLYNKNSKYSSEEVKKSKERLKELSKLGSELLKELGETIRKSDEEYKNEIAKKDKLLLEKENLIKEKESKQNNR